LEFKNPIYVSSQVDLDSLEVTFLRDDMFTSPDPNTVLTLGAKFMRMNKKIPK
jgi:hypothetical protein